MTAVKKTVRYKIDTLKETVLSTPITGLSFSSFMIKSADLNVTFLVYINDNDPMICEVGKHYIFTTVISKFQMKMSRRHIADTIVATNTCKVFVEFSNGIWYDTTKLCRTATNCQISAVSGTFKKCLYFPNLPVAYETGAANENVQIYNIANIEKVALTMKLTNESIVMYDIYDSLGQIALTKIFNNVPGGIEVYHSFELPEGNDFCGLQIYVPSGGSLEALSYVELQGIENVEKYLGKVVDLLGVY